MKKIIAITMFVFMLVASVYVYADANDNKAALNAVKNAMPDTYSTILGLAKDKWGSDYSMVEYEVGEQCHALIMVITLAGQVESNKMIPMKVFVKMYFTALDKWSAKGMLKHNLEQIAKGQKGDGSLFNKYGINISVDWSMILYELQNDIDAYGEVN